MSPRVSALALAALIIISAALTQVDAVHTTPRATSPTARDIAVPPYFVFQANSLASAAANSTQGPSRDWNVLDPQVGAASALVYSLDDDAILLGARTYARWPMASLTKLLSAIVTAEDLGYHKRIVMTDSAIATEGNGIAFNPNEEFSARDLARIMVMTSSNDAAAALEEHVGGRDAFLTLMRATTEKIGMAQTILTDAAGLSRANESSASDMVKLLKYLATARPEILEWTRAPRFLFQPTNDPTSRTAVNINPFADDPRFLGGKTGTLPEARENFAGIFTLAGRRVAVVVLGSADRIREVNQLLDWVIKAYTW
ncbi:MAG: serine hydrolase [Candidatus Jorgensenbacteria bacterium]|nr:serine hydrolase [Candidatus Jorgensenbacteria bacterium]